MTKYKIGDVLKLTNPTVGLESFRVQVIAPLPTDINPSYQLTTNDPAQPVVGISQSTLEDPAIYTLVSQSGTRWGVILGVGAGLIGVLAILAVTAKRR